MKPRLAFSWLVGALLAALVVLRPGVARADLVLAEPQAGLHLAIRGGCRVKPGPAEAPCASFAASGHRAEAFAVVLGPDGLLDHSVGLFTSLEQGGGEERARRIVDAMGGAAPSAVRLVSYGGQDFLRSDLTPETGDAVVFVSVDRRPEVALVLFASEPSHRASMREAVERTMPTVSRTPAPAPSAVAPPPPRVPEPAQPSHARTLALVFVGVVVMALVGSVVAALRR